MALQALFFMGKMAAGCGGASNALKKGRIDANHRVKKGGFGASDLSKNPVNDASN